MYDNFRKTREIEKRIVLTYLKITKHLKKILKWPIRMFVNNFKKFDKLLSID